MATTTASVAPLEFLGSSVFRHHLVASLLAGRAIKLSGLHLNRNGEDGSHSGLQEHEANFLKFVDRVTNGTEMRLEEMNTALHFKPGFIMGGSFTHAVPASRGIGYVVEAALMILPFAKFPSEITFTGATQHELDLSLDTIRTVTLRWLQLFGVEASLRIVRRGAGTDPGGCAVLSVSNVRKLNAVRITDSGKIKRIRGIAFGSNCSPDLPNRAATAAKGVMLNLLPDVYVVTDMSNKKSTGEGGSSGYGVLLVAESTSNVCILAQETVGLARETPEQVGQRAAQLLIEQVMAGGCVDAHHQAMVLLLAALAKDDLSTIRFGELTELAISALGMMETYFGVTCAMKEEAGPGEGFPRTVLISMMGSNAINLTKRSG
jgi:RNA 3'-terminal phosphate cyclase-like protein